VYLSVTIEPTIVPIRFFNFPGNGSPNGWRVHICLEEKDIPYRQVILNPLKLDHKSPEYLEINDRGKIPSILDNGVCLSESMAIIQYLNERSESNPLVPKDRHGYATCLMRMSQFTGCLNPIYSRIIYKGRMMGLTKNEMFDEIQALHHELFYWESYVEDCDYLCGNRVSLADIALFPSIAEFYWMGLDLDGKYPNLARWYHMMKRRDSIKKTWPSFMGIQVLSD
jgi:glutathione S-transferase